MIDISERHPSDLSQYTLGESVVPSNVMKEYNSSVDWHRLSLGWIREWGSARLLVLMMAFCCRWWCCRGWWCQGGSPRWSDINPRELNILMELEFELGEERLGLGIPLNNSTKRCYSFGKAPNDRSSYQRWRETISLVFRKRDESRYCSVVENPTPGNGQRQPGAVATLAEWCAMCRRWVNGVSPRSICHVVSQRLDDVRPHSIIAVLPIFKVVVNIIQLQRSTVETLLFYPVLMHMQDTNKHTDAWEIRRKPQRTAATLKSNCTSNDKWGLCALRHGIRISLEAILACHPARSTEWLDCHPKSCELWRIRAGPIQVSSEAFLSWWVKIQDRN